MIYIAINGWKANYKATLIELIWRKVLHRKLLYEIYNREGVVE